MENIESQMQAFEESCFNGCTSHSDCWFLPLFFTWLAKSCSSRSNFSGFDHSVQLGLLGVKMFDTERYSSIMKKKIYAPRIKMIKQKLDVEGLDRLSGPWMLAVCLTDGWRLCSGLSQGRSNHICKYCHDNTKTTSPAIKVIIVSMSSWNPYLNMQAHITDAFSHSLAL